MKNFPELVFCTANTACELGAASIGTTIRELNGFSFSITTSEIPGGTIIKATACNNTGAVQKIDALEFRFTPKNSPVCAGDPAVKRFFRDGWGTCSPVGVSKAGDRDYSINPDYFCYHVADAARRAARPDRCYGENVAVASDVETGRALLCGALTTARQFFAFEASFETAGLELTGRLLGDSAELAPGSVWESETVFIAEGTDVWSMLLDYGQRWGKRMKARNASQLPIGWCSWYIYFYRITDADLALNIAYLSEHRTEFPVKVFQIDDGYESAVGDWLDADTSKFPRGMAPVAADIAAANLTPGIWVAPLIAGNDSKFYREHPEMLLRDADGKIITVAKWRNADLAALDPTRPDVQKHLEETFAALRRQGYTYFKLDFLLYACGRSGIYHRRDLTRAQALRLAVEAIRRGAGDDAFILGGTSPLAPLVGVTDSERVSTDIGPRWIYPDGDKFDEALSVPHVCRNISLRWWMHRNLWINDPDVHIARQDDNQLTETEVVLWTNALKYVGGALMLSDRFSTLAPERAALSLDLLADPDAWELRPVDLLENPTPELWLAIHRKTRAVRLAAFNFADTGKEFEVNLAKLAPGERYNCAGTDRLDFNLKPHESRVFDIVSCQR